VKYRVIITPEAESDLRKVYSYIRKQGAPLAARKWIAGARKEIKTLTRFPQRTPLAPEAHAFNEPIRELLYGKGTRGTYRIIYAIIDNCVFILHVRHGSMAPIEPEDTRK
jgi:plasmid stabilization system protein ParE